MISSLKRHIASGVAISFLLSLLLPGAARATFPIGLAQVKILSGTDYFNPRGDEKATIRYQVSNATAVGVSVKVFRVNGDTQSCDGAHQDFVKFTNIRSVDQPIGTYTATWDGKAGEFNTSPVDSGTYCFRITWLNPAPNSDGSFSASIHRLVRAGETSDSSNGTEELIAHSVTPPSLDPTVQESFIKITYSVNRRIEGRLSLWIHDSNDNFIYQIFSKSGPVETGTSTASWDGKLRSTGKSVPPGHYTYKFRVDGAIVSSGSFEILEPLRFEHSVTPLKFDPSKGEIVTVSFSSNRRIEGTFILSILSAGTGTTTRTLLSQSGFGPGSDSRTWNGTLENSTTRASDGIYTYRFTRDGIELGRGSFELRTVPTPPPGQFIESHSANPLNFNPDFGQSTTISYTVGRRVTNFRLAVFDSFANQVALLSTASQRDPGNYSSVWDGSMFSFTGNFLGVAPAGMYTYRFSADNEISVSGNVFVNRTPPPPSFRVKNLTPTFPSSFDPVQEDFLITFDVNKSARMDLKVYNTSNQFIEDILCDRYTRDIRDICNRTIDRPIAPGTYTIPWDGWDDALNRAFPNGQYRYVINGSSTQGESSSDQGFVTINAGTTTEPFRLRDLGATPRRFDPNRENTRIQFELNKPARVDVTVYQGERNRGGRFIEEIARAGFNPNFGTGTQSVIWDGMDEFRKPFPDGIYTFYIDARSLQGEEATVSGEVEILTNVGTLQVQNIGANPDPFRPEIHGRTALRFFLTQDADVTITIQRGNVFIITLPTEFKRAGENMIFWNGQDHRGQLVRTGDYTYFIDVSNGRQSDSAEGTVRVIREDEPPPPPPPADCGNFTDIDPDDPLCPAIDWVVRQGIFLGFPEDHTLRLDKVITRAQMTAVFIRAFGYPLESYDPARDRNLGFRDLNVRAWYMPYIKTFVRRGILIGYPDRRMRPDRTISNAEFFKVFIESARRSPLDIANFTLETRVLAKPFIDTPLHAWYIKYADFAFVNGIVTTSRFFPDRGITRREVIRILYETHLKGLIMFP